MAAAKEEIESEVDMEAEEEQDSNREEGDNAKDSTEDEKKQKFVQEMVEAGYEEALAIRALGFFDVDDSTAGLEAIFIKLFLIQFYYIP